MDLSKLSDSDLQALQSGDLTVMSPEGLEYLQAQEAPKKVPEGPDRTSMAGRFATGLADPFHGGAQLLERSVPTSTAEAVREINNKIPFMAQIPKGGVDQAVRNREREYQEERGDQAGKFDVWRAAGNVFSPPNLALSAIPVMGVSMLPRILSGAGIGGASGALTPVTEGKPEEFWDEKARQVGTGAGFGGLATGVAGAISKLISPTASRNADNILLQREGVPMTVGQTLGGPANLLEDLYSRIPVIGSGARNARERANQGFQQAAINRSQAPINRTVQGAGHDAIDEASRNVSRAYAQAEQALTGFTVDQPFQQQLAQLRAMAQGEPWAREFNNQIRTHVTNRLSQAGGMTPEVYHDTIKELRAMAETAAKSKLPSRQNYGHALGEVVNTMQGAARRFNPEADALFNAADDAFSNLAVIQRAGANAVNEAGEFTPRGLNRAIKANDTTVRDNRTARGLSQMQDLSGAAARRLGEPTHASPLVGGTLGTVGAGVAGMLNVLPEAGGAAAIGQLAYTPRLQEALRRSVMSRPASAQRAARMVDQTLPRLAPLSAVYGLQPSEE